MWCIENGKEGGVRIGPDILIKDRTSICNIIENRFAYKGQFPKTPNFPKT